MGKHRRLMAHDSSNLGATWTTAVHTLPSTAMHATPSANGDQDVRSQGPGISQLQPKAHAETCMAV